MAWEAWLRSPQLFGDVFRSPEMLQWIEINLHDFECLVGISVSTGKRTVGPSAFTPYSHT